MITINIVQRVFHIKVGNFAATAFTVDQAERQYFVTAKHVVPNLVDGDIVEFWHNGAWTPLPIRLVGHHRNADITVFASNGHIAAHPLTATVDGLVLGQDVYFLGFPLGLRSEVGELNRMFPVALVKKGCVSSLPFRREKDEDCSFFIDGNNTAGFSGGPVVFQKANERDFRVCGIIHGYMTEERAVEEIETSTAGQIVRTNTGIIKAYSIAGAIDLITANPIGIEIPTRN